ncbi:hypothetical protein QTP88_004770 [Uroleucon formosanum]
MLNSFLLNILLARKCTVGGDGRLFPFLMDRKRVRLPDLETARLPERYTSEKRQTVQADETGTKGLNKNNGT